MAQLASDSLLWIKAELDNTLLRARQALETYVEDQNDKSLIEECRAHLHQVQGTLRIVEVYGAATLAEEMEAVARGLVEGNVKGDNDDAFEVLMRAMLQLPDYLERIIGGQRDMPLVLLSLLNDLRSVRGEPLLSESSLFAQNLASRGTAAEQLAVRGGGDIVALGKKLRPKFQSALLGWFKSGNNDNLKILADIAAQLEQAAGTPGAFQLWWIVGGVLEALLDKGSEASVGLKQLLGQVDRQIKRLIDEGEQALNDNPPTELINNLLYYIGKATSRGERVIGIKESFKLTELLPEAADLEQAREGMAGPNVSLMRTVSAALKEDIAQVKDTLDIFVRMAKTDAQELAPLSDLLKKVADTLGVLGLDKLQTEVVGERAALEKILSGKHRVAESALMDIAGSLIKVETTLDEQLIGLTRRGALSTATLEAAEETAGLRVEETDFKEVSGAVIRESIINLARVKDAIVEYIKNPSQPEVLRPVPPLIQQIQAGLKLLEQERAAVLLDSLLAYIRRKVFGQPAVPPQNELDRMADAIVSVEFYLETVQQGRGNPEAMLDNAENCVQALGFPVGRDYSEETEALSIAGEQVEELSAGEEIVVEAPADAELEGEELPSLSGIEVEEAQQPAAAPKPAISVRPEEIDPEIVEIFLEESQEEMASLREHFPRWKKNPEQKESLTTVRRSFHTLKGSGRMVGAELIGEYAWSIENMLNRVIDQTIEASDEVFDLVEAAIDALPELIEQLEAGTEPHTDIQLIMARAHAMSKGEPLPDAVAPGKSKSAAERAPAADETAGMDPVLYDIFNREAQGHLLVMEEFAATGPAVPSEELVHALHTLHGSASMAGAHAIMDMGAALERYTRVARETNTTLSEEGIGVISDASAAVRRVLEALPEAEPADLNVAGILVRARALQRELDTARSPASHAESKAKTSPEAAQPAKAKPAPAGASAAPRMVAISELENFDPELAGIFFEEASELLEAIDNTLHIWSQERSNPEHVVELQRHLHTLKGGGRMAGITPMGDLSHEVETVLKRIADGHLEVSTQVLATVQRATDRLHKMLEQVCVSKPIVDAQDLILEMRRITGGAVLEEDAGEFAAPARTAAAAQQRGAGEGVEDRFAGADEFGDRRAASRIQQELVRVRGDLIENLLNNAGEVSIYRARLDQQMSTMNFNLGEMDNTVVRLREQLRKLEIETEAQILYQYEKEAGEDFRADFDPLEMDRYSLLQQLSRGLAETVSDLVSIQQLLAQHAREAETLLLQQSRVNTEIQDGLMRTRMVPFARNAQRLRRIVRQAADETGKQAELRLVGAEGEMDRQILERILGPLEHMMRNAVIHGIESPGVRKQAGKPEQGIITIRLYREGSEVVMQITDDGAGLNVSAIRKKAESLGMIRKGVELSDDVIMQFVLESGFSTAEIVTQAAGRGVGMDVVNSEIKQLGGSLRIESTAGKGAKFTIRLPFTLAITQALMVNVAEELYAIPLPSIEGIVRIPRMDLLRYMQEEHPVFSYGGQEFSLQYLGVLLGLGAPQLPEELESVPVLLVRAGEHASALVTEGMQGSREIVVKSVGPQLSNIRGISGATLLGDGSIVIILDAGAMVRHAAAVAAQGEPIQVTERVIEEQAEDLRTVAMVVDDSITVRRVTQRLLERYGMQVLTAKDGVDALALLQEHTPDVMLLDIEMPRMDGYELASHMRNDERFKDIPIIMITSRTGEKHRARAIEIGVNRYLGKPYQEVELLEHIAALVGKFNPERTRWE